MRRRRLTLEVRGERASHIVELFVSAKKLPYLAVSAPMSGCIGTPLTREHAASIRKWLNEFFAKGCEKHGAEHCIECEKRCEWCGDDGDMKRRKGQRVCENCAWQHDEEAADSVSAESQEKTR